MMKGIITVGLGALIGLMPIAALAQANNPATSHMSQHRSRAHEHARASAEAVRTGHHPGAASAHKPAHMSHYRSKAHERARATAQ